MQILLINDDGYTAKGLKALVEIMKPFGDVTVVAPKYHQSGMSMAVSLGFRPIAVKDMGMVDGVHYYYVDGTPATCAKFAMDKIFAGKKPDAVLSGINHGSNASTASWYSGTLGAAREACLAGTTPIAVSLDNLSRDADFSVVAEYFPRIFKILMANPPHRYGVIHNVNFPDVPASEVKGVRICTQGKETWIDEFVPYQEDIFDRMGITPQQVGIPKLPEKEEGEEFYTMAGNVLSDPLNNESTDNYGNEHGYITITPHNLDNTDYFEYRRLQEIGL